MTDVTAVHANIGALQLDGNIQAELPFDAQHVARAIVQIASPPLDVAVLETAR